jgi:hypothetical protein
MREKGKGVFLQGTWLRRAAPQQNKRIKGLL